MKSEIDVGFIERLRAAAKGCDAVADLLDSLLNGLLIDGNGNKEIIADPIDLARIENAIVAAAFVSFDRDGE